MNLKSLLGDKYRDDLTVEELLTLAEELEYIDPSSVVSKDVYNKLKVASDNNSKEAKEWKLKYNSTLSEQDKLRIETDEATALMQKELETLRRENNVMKYTNEFLASGYSEDLAKSTAQALAEGNMDVVFKNQKKFATQIKKEVENANLHNTKKPDGGDDKSSTITREDIRKMSLAEQTKFYQEHPDDYKAVFAQHE